MDPDLIGHVVITIVTILTTAGATLYVTNMFTKHSWEERVENRLGIIETRLEYFGEEMGKLREAVKNICNKINLLQG